MENHFSYNLSSKTYVVGTKRSCPFERPKHILKLMGKKIIIILLVKISFSRSMKMVYVTCLKINSELFFEVLKRCVSHRFNALNLCDAQLLKTTKNLNSFTVTRTIMK